MVGPVSPPVPSLKGEWSNICLLLALYFLQGIPIGLASSLPLLLSSKGASFSEQALFSLASWPYSLKLLWAPVVDSLYTSRWALGQRKSWIVPCQLLTGAVMITMGERVGDFIPPEGDEGGAINVSGLLATFLSLYFLVATQDIAVDGWALTLLRPENVGYASAANTVGQGVGVQAAYGLFLALDSAEVCNRYIRRPLGLPAAKEGMVSLGSFLKAWGAVFIVATLLVWALQPELARCATAPAASGNAAATALAASAEPLRAIAAASGKVAGATQERGEAVVEEEREQLEQEGARLLSDGAGNVPSSARRRRTPTPGSRSDSGGEKAEGSFPGAAAAAAAEGSAPGGSVAAPSAAQGVASAYVEFFRVLRLPHFILLALVMVTAKAGFSLTDRAAGLVMQGRGVPKETLAFVDMVSFPLQLSVQVRAGRKATTVCASRAASFPPHPSFSLLLFPVHTQLRSPTTRARFFSSRRGPRVLHRSQSSFGPSRCARFRGSRTSL
jgi:hypothetical protein